MNVIIDLPNGATVSRAHDGTIFVGKRPVDPTQPVGLLPVLELGPHSVPVEATAALPIERVLSLALTRGTRNDYWPRLAVEWLAKTGVPDGVRDALAAFAHSDRGSQQTRHAARRLLRARE